MFRALEYFLVIYMAYRLVKYLFMPARTVSSGSQGFNPPPQPPNRKEGSISIKDMPQTARKHQPAKDDGEYIDYEEIK